MHDELNLNLDLSQDYICYLLGFFWADCYFGWSKPKNCYEFSFEIKNEDFVHIWDLLINMGFKKYHTRTRKNSLKAQSSIRLARQKDMEFFEQWQFNKKNLGCPLYFELTDEMRPFFIKGFLDGDGSISLDKNNLFRVSFNGNKEQNWDFLEHFCNFLNIPYAIYRKDRKAAHSSHTKDHGYSVFEFTKMQDRIDFCKSIESISIGIARKLNIYQKFKVDRLSKGKIKYGKEVFF